MSLEGMHRKAVRKIKKRDAQLAKEGTTAGKQAAERRARIEAAESLSQAQMKAVDPARNGYQPEPTEGIICHHCKQFYTGSMSEHWAGHEA